MSAGIVSTGWFGDDVGLRSLSYRALAAFVVWPMLVSGLLCLGTGLVLGLGSKWGLIRYWGRVRRTAAAANRRVTTAD